MKAMQLNQNSAIIMLIFEYLCSFHTRTDAFISKYAGARSTAATRHSCTEQSELIMAVARSYHAGGEWVEHQRDLLSWLALNGLNSIVLGWLCSFIEKQILCVLIYNIAGKLFLIHFKILLGVEQIKE